MKRCCGQPTRCVARSERYIVPVAAPSAVDRSAMEARAAIYTRERPLVALPLCRAIAAGECHLGFRIFVELGRRLCSVDDLLGAPEQTGGLVDVVFHTLDVDLIVVFALRDVEGAGQAAQVHVTEHLPANGRASIF